MKKIEISEQQIALNTMKTKTITLYEFKELSETAKKKALESLYNINTDSDFWYECIYENFQTIAGMFGLEINKARDGKRLELWFSLSYSQSDGSSFAARVDPAKFVECVKSEGWKKEFPSINLKFYRINEKIEMALRLLSVSDYSIWVETANRETSIKVNWEHGAMQRRHPNICKCLDELTDLITDGCETLNEWFMKYLRDECDYLSSEAAIIETIEANGYTFTESGELEN